MPRTSSTAMRCDARLNASARELSKRKYSRIPAARGGRTAASSRFSANCRFSRKARPPTMFLWRRMSARDMQAWTAVRMIGESSSRTRSSDPKVILDFLKGPDFALAAFKGQRLTLRDWNLQLRQPILLSDGRMIVSVSPQEGFLHQVSELDTLGIDRPESQCRLK